MSHEINDRASNEGYDAYFRGFCDRCSKQLERCPLCRAVIVFRNSNAGRQSSSPQPSSVHGSQQFLAIPDDAASNQQQSSNTPSARRISLRSQSSSRGSLSPCIASVSVPFVTIESSSPISISSSSSGSDILPERSRHSSFNQQQKCSPSCSTPVASSTAVGSCGSMLSKSPDISATSTGSWRQSIKGLNSSSDNKSPTTTTTTKIPTSSPISPSSYSFPSVIVQISRDSDKANCSSEDNSLSPSPSLKPLNTSHNTSGTVNSSAPSSSSISSSCVLQDLSPINKYKEQSPTLRSSTNNSQSKHQTSIYNSSSPESQEFSNSSVKNNLSKSDLS